MSLRIGRSSFSEAEEVAMFKFIVEGIRKGKMDAKQPKGMCVWKRAEKSGLLGNNHSAQSMQQHFVRHMIAKVHYTSLIQSSSDRSLLLDYCRNKDTTLGRISFRRVVYKGLESGERYLEQEQHVKLMRLLRQNGQDVPVPGDDDDNDEFSEERDGEDDDVEAPPSSCRPDDNTTPSSSDGERSRASRHRTRQRAGRDGGTRRTRDERATNRQVGPATQALDELEAAFSDDGSQGGCQGVPSEMRFVFARDFVPFDPEELEEQLGEVCLPGGPPADLLLLATVASPALLGEGTEPTEVKRYCLFVAKLAQRLGVSFDEMRDVLRSEDYHTDRAIATLLNATQQHS